MISRVYESYHTHESCWCVWVMSHTLIMNDCGINDCAMTFKTAAWMPAPFHWFGCVIWLTFVRHDWFWCVSVIYSHLSGMTDSDSFVWYDLHVCGMPDSFAWYVRCSWQSLATFVYTCHSLSTSLSLSLSLSVSLFLSFTRYVRYSWQSLATFVNTCQCR